MKKLLIDILEDTNGPYVFKVIDSLINSEYPVTENLFKTFGTEFDFYNNIFRGSYFYNLIKTNNLENILSFVTNYTDCDFNITNYFNKNIKSLEDIINNANYSEAIVALFKYIDFSKLDENKRNSIIKLCIEKPSIAAFNYILDNYKFNLDKVLFYTEKEFNNKLKISCGGAINFLGIKDLSSLKNKYNSYIEKIDFSAITHSKFYSNPSREIVNKKDGDSNIQEKFKEQALYEEYSNLFYTLMQYYANKYSYVSQKKNHTRLDQSNMKQWAKDVQEVIDFFDAKAIKYYGNDKDIKQCFNLSLICLATSFPEILKKILRNKELIGYIDLTVKDINGNNLLIAMLKNVEIDLVNKILKISNKTINDFYYSDNYHLSSCINNTVLSFNRGKINKSTYSEINEFINNLFSQTDWSYKNEVGNILAQHLCVSKSTEFNLIYKENKLSTTARGRYNNYYLSLFLDIYKHYGIDFQQENSLGVKAQDYLFEYFLINSMYEAKSLFLDGSEEYKIKAYKSYSFEEKENFLFNFVQRMPDIVTKMSEENPNFLDILNSVISKMVEYLDFINDKKLSDKAFKKIVQMDFFKSLNSSNNTYYYSHYNNFLVVVEKYALLEKIEKEKALLVKKVVKI